MIVRIVLVAGALGLAALVLWHPAPPPAGGLTVTSPATPFAPAAPAHAERRAVARPADTEVYVAGAVRRPGLYRVSPGQRAADAVALAGGLTAGADPAAINLAARLADGDEVYAPQAGEVPRRRAASSSAHRAARHTASPPPGPVDVNTASAVQLAAVPGIGRAVAARIVEMRERAGAFSTLDELLDVAGMTQSKFDRARPYLQPP